MRVKVCAKCVPSKKKQYYILNEEFLVGCEKKDPAALGDWRLSRWLTHKDKPRSGADYP